MGTMRRVERDVSAATACGFRPRKEVMMSGEQADRRAELIRVAAIGDKAVGEVEGHLWSEDGVSRRDEGTSSSMTSRRAQR